MEKKVKTPEEKSFNKRWGKLCKLSPIVKNLDKNIGKAPKCSNKVKTDDVKVTVDTKGGKKKK